MNNPRQEIERLTSERLAELYGFKKPDPGPREEQLEFPFMKDLRYGGECLNRNDEYIRIIK